MSDPVDKKDILDISPIVKKDSDITKSIIEENNLDNIKNLVDEFNLNQTKKNALRIVKYNDLIDKISDEMLDRFNNKSDEFTNNDLLNYLQALQAASDKANKILNGVSDINAPPITINQINIKNDELDRESRRRVDDAVRNILASFNHEENNIEIKPEETGETPDTPV